MRAPSKQLEDRLCRQLASHKPIKLLLSYTKYSRGEALDPTPGFIVPSTHKASSADIVVVDKLSDIDAIRCDHLAACLHTRSVCQHWMLDPSMAVALLWCYAFGKVVAARKDVEAFMQSPSTKLEAAFLHFSPAVENKALGVQIKESMTQRLAHVLSS